MSARASSWSAFAESNIVIEFIDTALRGCAQVMFQNNPLTGLIFFVAIFVGAYQEGIPAVAYGCVLGTLVSTLAGYVIKQDRTWLRMGLAGYNGCLVGAALPTFLGNTPALWIYIVVFSIISVVVTLCIADIMKKWNVAPFTAPFVLITWVALLTSYSFSGLHIASLATPILPVAFHGPFTPTTIALFFKGVFEGISQVYLFSSVIGGILFLIGLAVESIWSAVFAFLGSLIAVIVCLLLGANADTVHVGLYAYSAVLTAMAVGCVFNKPSWRSALYALFAVLLTVGIQGALGPLLAPLGLPACTMPFNLASWAFLIPNRFAIKESNKDSNND